MRSGLTVLVLVRMLIGASSLGAQDIDLGDFSDLSELSLTDLLDVTVSIAAAGRIQSLEEAPGILSVITAEDIRRMGAQNLEDVMETVPGFEVHIDEIGRRKFAVRGVVTQGTSENILLLLNGVRLNDQLWGGATGIHFNFPVQNLRQIEVIRGPGSALFGSNAFLAVVNMVTWDAGTFDGNEVSVTGGTFGTVQAVGTAARIVGDVQLSGSFQYRRSDGYRLPVEVDAATLFDQLNGLLGIPPISLAPGRTLDSLEQFNVQARAGIGDFTFDAMFADHWTQGNIGRINTLGTRNFQDTNQLILSGVWNRELGTRTSLRASAGYMTEKWNEFLDPLPPGFIRFIDEDTRYFFPDGVVVESTVHERRVNGGLVLDHALSAGHDVSLGVGFEWEEIHSPETYGNFFADTGAPRSEIVFLPTVNLVDARDRSVFSGFVQDTWNPVSALGVTAGLRFDHYDDFGGTANPRLGLVWRVSDELYMKGLYGRAFRAPTFAELGFGFEGSLQGNPNLEPATINTFEAAVGYRRPNLRLGINYFANYIRDFIVAETPLSIAQIQTELTYFNGEGRDVQGVEVEARRSFGFDHDVFGNYTFQHVTDLDLDGPPGGAPEHLANVGFTLALGDFVSVSPVLMLRGERQRTRLDPRDAIPAYAVLNVNTRIINFFETLEFSLAVRNVLDEQYVDPAPLITMPGDYPQPGRHLLLKASYKF